MAFYFDVIWSSSLLLLVWGGCASWLYVFHYETTPIEIYRKFTSKNWKFSDKKTDIFRTSAQDIDCEYSLEPPRRRGGSNEYPQSIFLSRKKKNNVYPCKPPPPLIKKGFIIFCKSSPLKTVWKYVKCENLIPGKNVTNFSSAEFAHRVPKVKHRLWTHKLQ